MDSLSRNISSQIRLIGSVRVEVHHDDGRTEAYTQPNMIVNGGRDRIAALFAQQSTTFPTHLEVGTGTTAPTGTDTTLETAVLRNAVVSSSALNGVTSIKAYFSKTDANGSAISEVGLFDQSSGGTMFARSILGSVVNKDATIAMTITWTFTFADS